VFAFIFFIAASAVLVGISLAGYVLGRKTSHVKEVDLSQVHGELAGIASDFR
jgi:hypothetical protein